VVTSPSLDCVSRTCLRYPLSRDLPPGGKYNEKVGLCTAECTSADECERVPESPCTTGFTCGIAVTVGPFCCRKFCICKDYAVVPTTTSSRRRSRARLTPRRTRAAICRVASATRRVPAVQHQRATDVLDVLVQRKPKRKRRRKRAVYVDVLRLRLRLVAEPPGVGEPVHRRAGDGDDVERASSNTGASSATYAAATRETLARLRAMICSGPAPWSPLGARAHLDEHEQPTLSRDEIELADSAAVVPRDDRVAGIREDACASCSAEAPSASL